MIVAKRKPLAEIREMLGRCRAGVGGRMRHLRGGLHGGRRKGGRRSGLAAQAGRGAWTAARSSWTRPPWNASATASFWINWARRIGDYDAVVSLACGAGIQFLGEAYPEARVVPGVDTVFIGVAEEAGLWTERCRACGACRLGTTAGICPLTMCAKGLTNGPVRRHEERACAKSTPTWALAPGVAYLGSGWKQRTVSTISTGSGRRSTMGASRSPGACRPWPHTRGGSRLPMATFKQTLASGPAVVMHLPLPARHCRAGLYQTGPNRSRPGVSAFLVGDNPGASPGLSSLAAARPAGRRRAGTDPRFKLPRPQPAGSVIRPAGRKRPWACPT